MDVRCWLGEGLAEVESEGEFRCCGARYQSDFPRAWLMKKGANVAPRRVVCTGHRGVGPGRAGGSVRTGGCQRRFARPEGVISDKDKAWHRRRQGRRHCRVDRRLPCPGPFVLCQTSRCLEAWVQRRRAPVWAFGFLLRSRDRTSVAHFQPKIRWQIQRRLRRAISFSRLGCVFPRCLRNIFSRRQPGISDEWTFYETLQARLPMDGKRFCLALFRCVSNLRRTRPRRCLTRIEAAPSLYPASASRAWHDTSAPLPPLDSNLFFTR